MTTLAAIKMNLQTEHKYAIIGAGPSGLGAAQCFLKNGILFDGFEASNDVGGLWNIHNPFSTVYQSAHLISSKKMTEFSHFPMGEEVADYPDHATIKNYFQRYAKHYELYDHFQFNTRVSQVEPLEKGWQLTLESGKSYQYKGIVIANGTLSKPNWPQFPGKFNGTVLHAATYKSPEIFQAKRVLIVGAGNSGCDIAVDAVHRAEKVDMSVRRGYHFVPKYMFGKPADTIGGAIKLPRKVKQAIDKKIVSLFTGDPQKFGFPEPDHKIYESHPIVNSMVLHHIGHGDIKVRKNIAQLEGDKVKFEDGSIEAYDLILYATGYKLNFPFIDHVHLNWAHEKAPQLYLNIFPPQHHNLFVIGMLEATGLGWQGRYEQAELVARFILHTEEKTKEADLFIQRKQETMPDTTGGFRYLSLDRMAYYVHKDTYKKEIKKHMNFLGTESIQRRLSYQLNPLNKFSTELFIPEWKEAHNVLITGGRGYLGRQLTEALSKMVQTKGGSIISLDVSPIKQVSREDEIIYLEQDIRSPKLKEIFEKYRIDTIVHLAAIVSPSVNSDPKMEYSVDVEGTQNVLQAAVNANVKRIVITSSGAAYGYYKDNPDWITEELPVRGNEEFAYAKHKRLVEEMLASYRIQHPELAQVIFRIGTILGEQTQNNITAFLDRPVLPRVLGWKSPFVFVWDKDVVQCLIQAIESEKVGIFNVAGDGSITLKEIARMMHKRSLVLPAWLFRTIFSLTKRMKKTRYGSELVHFLQYRPVLSNKKLKEVYNYIPKLNSRETFELYLHTRRMKSSS